MYMITRLILYRLFRAETTHSRNVSTKRKKLEDSSQLPELSNWPEIEAKEIIRVGKALVEKIVSKARNFKPHCFLKLVVVFLSRY
jgi:hypothetical protein